MAKYDKKTPYPGIYERTNSDGRTVYVVTFRDERGMATSRVVRGSIEDAARAKEEILRATRPTVAGGSFAAPAYYEASDLDWIVQSHSNDGCVYVGQRKINPVIVKIGYSTFRGARKRMADERLHLLLAMPGTRQMEKELHERFAAYSCDVDGREFFFLARDVRAWIDATREEIAASGVVENGSTLRAVV